MKKSFIGVITSDKMDKTRTVAVERLVAHPIYKKRYRVHSKFLAHDEKNEYKKGERVRIEETRPLSKKKRWIITGREGAK
jgi:small subunit ribosomal protein S17